MRSPVQSLTPPRKGFTLLELLIVIAIIGMLAALLFPFLSGMRRNARVVEVRTEINNLEAAIAAFRNAYGIDPPSRFRLYEDTEGYLTEDEAGKGSPEDDERKRSLAILRQMWPRFNFADGGNDVNWNGSPENPPVPTAHTLNGAECLVFFLGGRIVGGKDGGIDHDFPGGGFKGFSKNAAHPFALGGTREGPFFEFDTGRIQDVFIECAGNPPPPAGVAGLPEYLDPLPDRTLPYWYTSSYGGKGYDLSNICFKTQDGLTFQVVGPFYRQNASAPPAPHNQSSFQLISPGFDGIYGSFGIFNPADPANGGIGEAGHDNITNVSDGMLSP